MKRTIPFLFFLFSTIGLMAQPDVYTPTLKFPADGATNMVPNLTVSWNAIAGSTNLQYQVQIDTTLNFNSPLKVDTTQVLLTGYKAHELLFGQKYYWRVRAIDQDQTSYWSAIRNFIIFDQVNLSKPTNNQKQQNPNVDIEWKNTVNQDGSNVVITGIRFRDYQYDSVNTFNSPALKEGSTSYAVLKANTSNLQFGKIYYYRVRARHNLSTSSWCNPWYFGVVDSLTLQLPMDNASAQMIDVQIKWKNITGILSYEYQLALDQNFNNIILQNEVDTNLVKCSLLQFGEKVYWRVRARQIHDTSSWSGSRNFTVINSVILKTPADASQNVDLKPKLIWTSQTGISGYQLQVDSVNTFANPIVNFKPKPEEISYTLSKTLVMQKTYYWRMRAFSDGGAMADTSAWSAPWSFVTIGPQGIEEPGSTLFSIYPNPASEKLTIKVDVSVSKTIQVSLVDLIGKTILNREFLLSSGTNIKEVSLDNINKGVYILRIIYDGQNINRKVIIDR